MNYNKQIDRIETKLKVAKKTDNKFKVFGASSHKYLINQPIGEKQISDFEKEYNIVLPDCYVVFLTKIGNGGCSYFQSAAGPFYGIYPLGENINELADKIYLSNPVTIYPSMTDKYWTELTQRIEEDEEMSDEEYDREVGQIYSGILPIGSQGCTYLHGLILNGEYQGKVVNLDLDFQKPRFTFENNFLDWYERWLDEVISGDLLANKPSWFGYVMGGTDREPIGKYLNSSEVAYKLECLNGLLRKVELSPETVNLVEKECFNTNEQLSYTALGLLTKINYARAKSLLFQTYQKVPLKVFQYIFWYAKESSEEWIDEIQHILRDKNVDSKLFRFTTYLVKECQTDLSELVLPFTEHDDREIQSQARYTLKELKKRN